MARAATTSTKNTDNGNTQDPAKDLEAEIAALRADIASITDTLGDVVKYRANEAKAGAQKIRRKVEEQGEEAIEAVQDNFEYAESELKAHIREKPIASVLIAAGVGYVISKIF